MLHEYAEAGSQFGPYGYSDVLWDLKSDWYDQAALGQPPEEQYYYDQGIDYRKLGQIPDYDPYYRGLSQVPTFLQTRMPLWIGAGLVVAYMTGLLNPMLPAGLRIR